MFTFCLIFLLIFSPLFAGGSVVGSDRSVDFYTAETLAGSDRPVELYTGDPESGTFMSGERTYIMYAIDNSSWTAISGTTNVNSFECLSPEIRSNGIVLTDFGSDNGRINFSDASLVMDVNSFDCRNPLVTRDMSRALGGDRARIYITLLDAELVEGNLSSSAGNFIANAVISLNDRSNMVELAIDWHRSEKMEYHFEGVTELSMADFDITPPSPALGMIRVDDKITVRFSYIIQPGIISSLN
jgi:hypothetical protein